MTLDALMAEGQPALQAGDVAVALAPDDLGLAWIRGVLLVRLARYQDALPHLVRAQGFTEQAATVPVDGLVLVNPFLQVDEEAADLVVEADESGWGELPEPDLDLSDPSGAELVRFVLEHAPPIEQCSGWSVSGEISWRQGFALKGMTVAVTSLSRGSWNEPDTVRARRRKAWKPPAGMANTASTVRASQRMLSPSWWFVMVR
jgi:hypothetical protein